MVPLIASLYLGLSFLIIGDNLLVICAVHSTRALRKQSHFLLVSLAVADLLVGVIVLPLRTVEVIAFEWTRGVKWCRFALCLSLLSLSASVLNLLLVTAERYFAILRPMTNHNRITRNRTKCFVAIVWVTALLVSFFPLLRLDTVNATERDDQHKICRFADTMSTAFLTFFPLVIVLIPTILISLVYIMISNEARKLRKRLLTLQGRRDQEQADFLKESKTSKTIGIVIGVFYLCWVPFMVAVALSAFFKNLVTPTVVLIVSLLVYSNSAMNPILYGCLNRDFRSAYKRLIPKTFLPCATVRDRQVLRRETFSLEDIGERQDGQGTYSQVSSSI